MREDGGIESEVLANKRAVDVMVVNPARVIRIELTKHIKGKLTVRKEKPSSKILECILEFLYFRPPKHVPESNPRMHNFPKHAPILIRAGARSRVAPLFRLCFNFGG
jgi:hypothetical protein